MIYYAEQIRPQLSERYVYGIQSGQFIKIGVAVDIAKRLDTMRLSNPHPLAVVFKRKMKAAYFCEKKMHEVLRPKSLGREWFNVTVEEVRQAALIGAAHAREVYARDTKALVSWRAGDTRPDADIEKQSNIIALRN
jgi:hypothetical protein